MGEISFNYDTRIEPKQEVAFKYWFSESIEYSFAYQRYIAFSDASIFNSPVAITKVATGLSQLHWLFADKKINELTYVNLINSLKKSRESTRKESILFNKQRQRKSDLNKYIRASNENPETDIFAKTLDVNKNEIIANKEAISFLTANDIILNFYNDSLIGDMQNFEQNVYQQIFATTDKNKLNIIADEQMQIINDSTLNVYKILFGNIFKSNLNKLKGIELSSFDNKLNVEEIICITPTDNMALNEFKSYFVLQDVLKLNSLNNILAKKTDVIHGHIIEQLNIKNNDIINASVFSSAAAYQYNKIGDYFSNNYFAIRYHEFYSSLFKDIAGGFKKNNLAFNTQQYMAQCSDKPMNRFNKELPVELEKERSGIHNDIVVNKDLKKIYAGTNAISGVYLSKDNKPIFTSYKLVYINKDRHGIDIYKYLFVDKDRFSMEILSSITVDKDRIGMIPYKQQDIVVKDRFSIEIYKSNILLGKDRKGLSTNNKIFTGYKSQLLTTPKSSSDTFLQKSYRKTFVSNELSGVYKNFCNAYFYPFGNIWLNKEHFNTSLSRQIAIDKLNHYISAFNQCCADIESRRASVFKQGQQFIKKMAIVDAPQFDFVIKNNIPTDYNNVITDDFAGMIIPLSKVKNHIYIDRINEMVQKVSKNGFINQSISFSVMPQKMSKQLFELFCDKKEFNAYVEYKNIQIIKSKVKSAINTDKFFTKNSYSAHIKNFIWVDKNSQKTWIDAQINVYKKVQGTFLNDAFYDNARAVKESKKVYINNASFVDKKDKMCYYDYNTTWADKSLMEAQIQAQMTVNTKEKKSHMLDCVSPIVKKDLNGFYDYGVFGNKNIQGSGLYNQINDVQKKAYDTGIRPEDFGNWAWVYETPDPFGNGFNIDELLLPENDTRYEDFEDIIFDKENMRPRNPVKEINENTFIAKYPIRHPLPKYKDVGVNYEASAIKVDQFYGIEVEVMHDVFLKFYRIWQAKIFEFGTMTMTQSVKLMLEYLYAWIFVYFPVEKVEQALRVFRLIRWYGESSIIKNSQYIVSYEYDILESKLNTGKCLVPNDLDVQDTMYVDAALGVIRNNPTYVNNGPAYVTFEINNKKNTTFTFSLSNTIGSVNIYINDVLADVISKSALNLTYDLPYTGDTNVVKIEKPANHNLNDTFYIGNIKIPNCSFKELNIEFDPNLKAGNKPLDEIAKKMISYANLYEDKDAAYEIIRKGNLGVEEIQKQLQEYWELHHKDKTKGKRLTIKEI